MVHSFRKVFACTGVCALAGIFALLGSRGTDLGAASAAPEHPIAVVAELFTSEGCSSCPAADDLLTRLTTEQPFAGIQLVALGEHVDYWDRLGWRDPFSSPAFTARQSEYASSVFRTGRIYTPQIVIDGAQEAVGSDAAAVRRAVLEAARRPRAELTLRVESQAQSLDAALAVRVGPAVQLTEAADLMLALTENQLRTNVRRGENSGRTLKHTAVVRSLTRVASLASGQAAIEKTVSVPLDAGWNRGHLQVAAFLQARESRRIVGAAIAPAGPR